MTTPRHYAQIQDRREETFERVRRAFRWTVAAAVTGVAVIIGVVAHEIPGRSTVASTTSNNASGNVATTLPAPGGGTGNTGGNTGAGAVSPQVTPPAPTQRAPTAVSGGTGW